MAKSIYDTLDDLITETSVPKIEDKDGNVLRKSFGLVKHTLPRKGLPTSEQFEDEEELLAWATESGNLHACLQSGVQARLIDYRAIFKGMKKTDIWSPEFGQANVDKAEWKIVNRPNVNNTEAVKEAAILTANLDIAKAMKATGQMSDELILATLTTSCGDQLAAEIMETLKEED